MDSGGAEEKNSAAGCDCFPADCVNFCGVGSAICDDFDHFGVESLEARNKLDGGAIASRKKDAFVTQFGRELVGEGCGGSALADVSDIETGQLCRLGRGIANGGDAEGSWGSVALSRREIPRCAGNDGLLTRSGDGKACE